MEENATNNPTKLSPLLVGGLIALVAIIGLGAVMVRSQNNTSATPGNVSPTNRPTSIPTSLPSVTGAQTDDSTTAKIIAIEGGSFYFKPNEIRVKKGEKVKITLTAVDMMHDFVVDELDIKAPITKSGESSTVEFTATTAGEFEFYCSVGQHRKMGQVGTLIVEE
jgi:plastocyanin